MSDRAKHQFMGTRAGRWLACAVLACTVSPQAMACKFIPRNPAELLKAADVVFVGKVEEAVDGRSGQVGTGWAVFEVVDVQKGSAHRGDRIKVLTHNSSCGLAFQAGQVWTVYAAGRPLRSDAPSGSFIADAPTR